MLQSTILSTSTKTRNMALIRRGIALCDRLDHGAADLVRLLEPGLKERGRLHKPVLVQLKVAKCDTLTPSPGRDDKL